MTDVNYEDLKRLIREELAYKHALDEGLWDDVKQGAEKLMQAVSSRVKSLNLDEKAKEVLNQFTVMPDWVNEVMNALKKGMAESGESVKLDKTLQAAKALGSLSSAKEIVSSDLKGPVHAKAAEMQKEGMLNVNALDMLQEFAITYNIAKRKSAKALNEAQELNEAGIISAAGVTLAAFGGTVMIIKGLYKLAKWMGAEKTAEALHRAHEVLHKIEQETLDFAVPNVLSWHVYNVLRKVMEFKGADKDGGLTKKEFYKNSGHVKSKVNRLIYSTLLIFLAWNGLKVAIHAGVSLLGVTEGTATAIKAGEIVGIAKGVSDIA